MATRNGSETKLLGTPDRVEGIGGSLSSNVAFAPRRGRIPGACWIEWYKYHGYRRRRSKAGKGVTSHLPRAAGEVKQEAGGPIQDRLQQGCRSRAYRDRIHRVSCIGLPASCTDFLRSYESALF